MALTPTIRFEGEYDKSLKAVTNSNLKKQRVIPDGKLVYADSNSLPPKLPSDTLLFTTDTRELYIGTGETIKRVNIGNDGDVIDKGDYLTKVEAAKIYIQKDDIPDELVTEEELAEALAVINSNIDQLLLLSDDIVGLEDKYLKKEDAKNFVNKDKLNADLSKKVDIENLTATGNHTFVRNDDNGVSLEYQNVAGEKDSSIVLNKDKIIINSSNTNGDKNGSKLYINQNGIYYTNSNDNNFESSDEILTKKDKAELVNKITKNETDIQNINSNLNEISQNVSNISSAVTSQTDQLNTVLKEAEDKLTAMSGVTDDIVDLKGRMSTAEENITKTNSSIEKITTSVNTINDYLNETSSSIKSINNSISTLNSKVFDDHERRISNLEEKTQDNDLSKINKSITDMAKIISDNENNIENLTTRVSTNESNISKLQNETRDIETIRAEANKVKDISDLVDVLSKNLSNVDTSNKNSISEISANIKALQEAINRINERIDSLHPEEKPEKRNITSINEPAIFKNGIIDTPFGVPVSLPRSIEVTLDNGDTEILTIMYDKELNISDIENIQTINGTIVLPSDGSIENPENFSLSASFKVYNYIYSTSNALIEKNVKFGTQFNDIPDIPMTINCILGNSETETFDIDWTEAKDAYDPENPVKQSLKGNIVEKNNIRNTNNITVTLNVTVESKVYNIISVNNDEGIHEVEFNTKFTSLGLPPSVEVVLDDNSTKNVVVNWNENTYSSTDTVNEQIISGTLVPNSNISNTNELTASFKVKVKEKAIVPKNIIQVESINLKSVEFNTAFDDLGLPPTINVSVRDDVETNNIELAVNWRSSDYNPKYTKGNQTIIGDLVLIDGITNTNNITASCEVSVEAGDAYEWTEYVKLESFANNIRNFPSKIGHEFTDDDAMGIWDEDDDTIMLKEPVIEFRYLGCLKTLTEGDKQTVTLLTEEQVHDPAIMNQNLMAVYPEGILNPMGEGYETKENIDAFDHEVNSRFGFTTNGGYFLEDGLLRFENGVHENQVFMVRKKNI